MNKFLLASLAAAALLTSLPASAQTPLFSENSELQAIIESPLSTLVRQSARNTDPHPATFSLNGDQTFSIQLSARGVSRRTRGICSFPPLRLDFEGDAVRGTSMRGQNRLKLVTRCRPGLDYEQMVVLEYLAYRMFNEITPLSFRVRPLVITYRDAEGRRREEEQFNFVIEGASDMARRNERRVELEVLPGVVRYAELDARAASEYALFQYMIGNLDWDMATAAEGEESCCHNSKLIATSQEARVNVIPVPYDFDASGLVNAPYAAPPERFGLRDVRQRYYRGLCRFNDHVPAAIETMQARRSAINALIANEPRLSASRRTSTQRYIDDFYEIIADPARVQRQLIANCRG